MQATVNIHRNPFHHQLDYTQVALKRRQTILTINKNQKIDFTKPVLVYYNGQPLLRKQWGKTCVKDGDVVSYFYLPQGGGGSNPLRLVLMVALAAFAPQMVTALSLKMGVMSEMGISLLGAGVGMLGNALINAIVPPPKPPKAQQQAQLAAPSPTYSLSAQGNQARLGQPIPVIYGRMKVFPDFAAQPYAEYENNEQYLYQLFCVGQGNYLIDSNDIFVEDSSITAFGSDFSVEIVQPNTISTLFPKQIYNVSEVSGQELLPPLIGPFGVNPPGTMVDKLAFDIVLPKGLGYVNDEGGYDVRTLSFKMYAQRISDEGANIGGLVLLGTEPLSGRTPTAMRRTYKYNVTPGRYRVSAQRDGNKNEDTRVFNDVTWVSARGYAQHTVNYGDKTLLAIKMRATNTISNQSSRKINLLCTRQLPIPSLDVNNIVSWSAPVATQSIAWAIADMCRAAYGAGVSVARFNVNQLIALDTLWTTRGDKINCVFDSSQTFWEALTIACRVGRVRPYIQGGMIHFFRDSLQTLPTALFSNNNIVKDSLKVTYVMSSEDNADAIDMEYFDETIWKTRTVRAKLSDSQSLKPIKIQCFGITSREQAFKEGMYMAAANRYRRKEISFTTELEGHIPSLGDLIAVQSDVPQWGQNAEVESYTSGQFVVNEYLEWTPSATHYMMVRSATGGSSAPIVVTKGADDNILNFTDTELPFDVYTGPSQERTHIIFGRSGQVVQLARVLGLTPQGDTVNVSSINEDARVHAADGTPVPLDILDWALPSPQIKPVLTDFTLTQTGSGTTPSILVSWNMVAGASRYLVEKSYDDVNWETVSEVASSNLSFLATVGTLYVRVAAYGGVLGPYVTKSIVVGQVAPPADVPSGAINALGQSFVVNWAAVPCDSYFVEVLNAGSTKRSFTTVTTNFEYTLESAVADGGPWRNITVRIRAVKGATLSAVALTLAGVNAAPATPQLVINPGAKSIAVTVSKCDESDYSGTLIHASTSAAFTPDNTNLVFDGTGNFYLINTSTPLYIKAAHYDTYGKTGLNYSTEIYAVPSGDASGIRSVSALPATAVEGDLVFLTTDGLLYSYEGSAWVAAGSTIPNGSITNEKIAALSIDTGKLQAGAVTAQKMSVVALAAITANLGAVTAGSVTLDNQGFIRGGQTAYNTGTGFYLGYSGSTYKFSLGNSTQGITWDGSSLEIKGTVAGALNIANTGHIKGGQTAYNVGNGFFLGFDGGQYKFSIGRPDGQFLKWDGVELTSNGLSKLGGMVVYDVPGVYYFTIPDGISAIYLAEMVGGGGAGGHQSSARGQSGGTTSFGSFATATGGQGGHGSETSNISAASGGVAFGVESEKGFPRSGGTGVISTSESGRGGSTPYGQPGYDAYHSSSGVVTSYINATGYGCGGRGYRNTAASAGGGGGAGGVATWKKITGVPPGTVVTVTVGAGGQGINLTSGRGSGHGSGGKMVIVW